MIYTVMVAPPAERHRPRPDALPPPSSPRSYPASALWPRLRHCLPFLCYHCVLLDLETMTTCTRNTEAHGHLRLHPRPNNLRNTASQVSNATANFVQTATSGEGTFRKWRRRAGSIRRRDHLRLHPPSATSQEAAAGRYPRNPRNAESRTDRDRTRGHDLKTAAACSRHTEVDNCLRPPTPSTMAPEAAACTSAHAAGLLLHIPRRDATVRLQDDAKCNDGDMQGGKSDVGAT